MSGTTVRRKRANRRSIRLVIIAAIIFALFFAWKINDLKVRNQDLEAAKQAVEQRIAEEEARGEQLANQGEQELTEDYVIQIARDRYGLVFPDEIVFIPEN